MGTAAVLSTFFSTVLWGVTRRTEGYFVEC